MRWLAALRARWKPVLGVLGALVLAGIGIGMVWQAPGGEVPRPAILAFLLAALAALGSAYLVGRDSARGIAELAHAAERIARGELEGIELGGRDQLFSETTRLAAAVAEMARTLRERTATVESLTSTFSASTRKVTDAVDLLALSNTEHAAAVTETATTVEEMERNGKNAGRNAGRIVEAADKTAEASVRGQKALGATERIILEIREDSRAISNQSDELLSAVEEIAIIIGSVKEIADQSKILAVNAAVEAAKAGEYGAGFAVVAREIKNLAQQSKSAAMQITATLDSVRQAIETMVSTAARGRQRSEEGVEMVGNTGAVMNDLNAAIRENSGSAIAIASSIKQQTVGLTQIANAIEQINAVAMENEVTSSGLARNVKEMNERVSALLEQVESWQSETGPDKQATDRDEGREGPG